MEKNFVKKKMIKNKISETTENVYHVTFCPCCLQ